jgi:long-chain fatty acid transport protein
MRRVAPFLGLVVLLVASRSAASGADLFGLGPRASAQAGAVAASATDFSAVYYNPAGLAESDTTELALGVLGFGSGLTIGGRAFGIADPVAVLAGGHAPLPLGGVLERRLYFGLALSVVPTSVLRIISRYPEEPFFPLYDNRTQRLLLLPGVGLRLTDTLSLGVAFNYLAGLSGSVQGTTGASRTIEPRVDETIGAEVAVHGGVRWAARPWLALGLAYRQSFSVPFANVSDVRVAGQPLSLSVQARGLYSPDQLALGVSLRPHGRTTVGLDATWARWSAWEGPYIRVASELPLAGELAGELPRVPFSDIVTVHLGLDQVAWRSRRLEVHVRGGYGYDPSPVPAAQPGVTNLMDGPKHVLGLGGGLRLAGVLGRPLTVDGHVGLHVVRERSYTKRVFGPGEGTANPYDGLRDEVKDVSTDPSSQGIQISNPGYPGLGGGGHVWAASLLVGVEL